METREFVVRLQTTVASIDGLTALRATLNFARGRFGLRTVDACEVIPTAPSHRESIVDVARSVPAPAPASNHPLSQ